MNQAIFKGLDAKDPMKGSGIEWFGKIPKHWEISKLKYLVTKIDELNELEVELKIAVENILGFKGKLIDLESFNYEGNTTKFKINDIIFNKLRPYLGKVYFAEEEGGVYGELLVLRPLEKLVPKFLFYIMISTKFIDLVNSSTTGAKMPRASWEDFIKNIPIPVISKNEQKRIVVYLDKEVGKIDSLIEKKTTQLMLFEEKKKAVINQAITNGLNLNVPMKDTGIKWLGKIPNHWKLVKLKYLTDKLKYGANEAAEEDNHDDPRYIRITDIDENGNLKDETYRSISTDLAEDYILKDGDILLARSGATVGKSFLYRSKYGVSAYAGYLVRMRCNKKINSDFMYYFTLSNVYWNQISIDSIQATIQNYSGEKYANMLVIVPDDLEQEKISIYIKQYLKQYNLFKSNIIKSINLLKEKRSEIIFEAITGKIEL